MTLPSALRRIGLPVDRLLHVGDAWPAGAPPRETLARRVDAAPPTLDALPDASYDAAVLTGLDPDAADAHHHLVELQRILHAGGLVLAWPSGQGRTAWRRLHEHLLHYFDPAVGPGEAFPLPLRPDPRARPVTGLMLRRRGREAMQVHFEALAPTYWNELPRHVQDHFFEQKTRPLFAWLATQPRGLRGLDVGCGIGQYAQAAAARAGARMVGVDTALGALAQARRRRDATPRPEFLAADSLRLPFPDAAFDFAYVVNVLHHLKRGDQERALMEIRRVLRPGGTLIVQEMNTRNPLFAWYLRNVYPRTRRIDRGDEEYLDPARLPLVDGLRTENVDYFTFTPDFVPAAMLPLVRGVERRLERGRWASYAIHYAARLARIDAHTASMRDGPHKAFPQPPAFRGHSRQ